MSDSSPEPTKSINRWSIRTSVALQIISLCIAVTALNFLSCRNWKPLDFSDDQNFTLSSLTNKVLSSKTVTDRTEPIRMIVAYRRSSPFSTRIRNLASTYERSAKGKIVVEYVDPLRNPNRAQEIETTYKTIFTEDKIIIDARPKNEEAAKPIAEKDKDLVNAPNKNFELSAHIRFLTPETLFIYDVDKEKGRYIAGYKDEDAITSAILTAAEGKPRRIYLLADKSDLTMDGDNSPLRNLTETLYNQNIALIPLSLTSSQAIPEDADALAIIAPKYDFDDRELAMITNYWNKKKSAIFITLDPSSKLGKLKTFLRAHGITPRTDRVVSVAKNQTITSLLTNFTKGPEINAELSGQASVFEGGTTSLEVREDDEALLQQRIITMPLISTSADYWSETRYGQSPTQFDENEDTAGPITIAAAVVRGNANDEKLASETSRIVTIANTDFLKADRLREEQLDFVNSSINWLVGRSELIGVGPRALLAYKLNLTEDHTSKLDRITLFFMPALAFIMGLIIWRIRRA